MHANTSANRSLAVSVKLSLRAVAKQSGNKACKTGGKKPAKAKKARVTNQAEDEKDCRATARNDRFGRGCCGFRLVLLRKRETHASFAIII